MTDGGLPGHTLQRPLSQLATSYSLAFSCRASSTSLTTSCEQPYDDW